MSFFKWFGKRAGKSITIVDVPDPVTEIIVAEFANEDEEVIEVTFTSNPGAARYVRRSPKLGSPEWQENFDRAMDGFEERREQNARIINHYHNRLSSRDKQRDLLDGLLLKALHEED
ncbi:MAG: hypothetical protein DRQ64_00195 [Gammaproteobacteria bacterium]|nr:MAG: hypothetical protein DRQ64_00195 [Gammaproteobacteria bacterium]